MPYIDSAERSELTVMTIGDEVKMYDIDKNVFLMATGSHFQSDIGVKLRQIAVKSLRKICGDILEERESNRALAHKVKGIALSCGAKEIARICLKLEHYDAVINKSAGKEILLDVSNAMIRLCDA
ncbi:Phosphorelay protein [Vibrio chagasii]|nr:Phosphorelay protein [Vibrio chagasii]